MNLKNLFCIVSVLLATNGSSVAAEEHWTEFGKVSGINIDMRTSPGRVLIEHEVARSDNCSNTGNFYHLDLGHPQAKLAFSLLLSSEATQRDVQLSHNGCSASGYPLLKVVSTF